MNSGAMSVILGLLKSSTFSIALIFCDIQRAGTVCYHIRDYNLKSTPIFSETILYQNKIKSKKQLFTFTFVKKASIFESLKIPSPTIPLLLFKHTNHFPPINFPDSDNSPLISFQTRKIPLPSVFRPGLSAL